MDADRLANLLSQNIQHITRNGIVLVVVVVVVVVVCLFVVYSC